MILDIQLIMNISNVNNIINNSIILFSSARSGSTLLGKIMGSTKNSEYCHEPKFLSYIIANIDNYKKVEFKNLFNCYVYEDFLTQSLAGRNINTNKNDDSSIYNFKDTNIIKKRLIKTNPKILTIKQSKNSIPIIKILHASMNIEKFIKIKKDIRVVRLIRNPHDLIASLLKKRWLSNYNLKNLYNEFSLKEINNIKVPYWYKGSSISWYEMKEIDRCFYYYLNLNAYNPNKKILLIDYDDFIKSKAKREKFFHYLNLKKTSKTESILKSLKINKNKIMMKKIITHDQYQRCLSLYHKNLEIIF